MPTKTYLDGSPYNSSDDQLPPGTHRRSTFTTFEDGRPPVYDLWPLDPDGELHVVASSDAVGGPVELSDGTTYDVSNFYTVVASAEHAKAADFHIARKLASSGRLASQIYGEEANAHPRVVVVGDENSFHFAHEGTEDTPLFS